MNPKSRQSEKSVSTKGIVEAVTVSLFDFPMGLSYESSGVRYDQLDAFKRACQRAARTTAGLLADHGYS